MPERRVRVVCPRHAVVHIGWATCRTCGTGTEAPGTILATLADPEAEALMADGEKWRVSQRVYDTMPDLTGVRWNAPTPEADDDGA